MIYSARELTKKCEEGRIVGASTCTGLSVTGEPYVKIGIQATESGIPSVPGTVDEGAAFEWGYDEETAFWGAWNCFCHYSEERNGVLYWRIKPRLVWNESKRRCYFQMRCLISDAPVLNPLPSSLFVNPPKG
jgi:hypothetical protein